ncbi:MAG: MFS transporter [Leptospiraceae bacterium]|nr:MFS transporter [Leptospiraceae bacterium]
MRDVWQKIFKAPPHVPLKSKTEIDAEYPKWRWRILEATFIGYASFYFVRNNFAPVSKEFAADLGYSRSDIGDLLALTAISYGLGKFLMGAVSDRSNVRRFMPFGLLLTALLNIAFGSVSVFSVHLALWSLNGFVQGMGWGPCGRSIGHWFSVGERGKIFGIWNIAHNVGGGIIGVLAAWVAGYAGWRSAFYVPAALSILSAFYLFWRLRDTPQSIGLPSIAEYRNDYPPGETIHNADEHELSFREIFIGHVLKNKIIWIIAIANFFVYIVRYSLIDWGPTYLKEAKGATLNMGGISTLVYEFAGIFSTLLVGYLSDKADGRRGAVSLICLFPVLFAAFVLYALPGLPVWGGLIAFGVVGFFIYPPVMLLGVAGLDFTSRKAVGAAAGFIGLSGYLGRTVQGKGLGYLSEYYSWDAAMIAIVICALLAILMLTFTWNLKPRA